MVEDCPVVNQAMSTFSIFEPDIPSMVVSGKRWNLKADQGEYSGYLRGFNIYELSTTDWIY